MLHRNLFYQHVVYGLNNRFILKQMEKLKIQSFEKQIED